MNPKAAALQERAHEFFVKAIEFCRTVPDSIAGRSICEQLVDSSGSTDSNYRAACKARSRKEFIAKIGVAAEEAAESLGWLQALKRTGLGDEALVIPLIEEADELTSIFVTSGKTAAARLAEETRRKAKTKPRRSR